MLGKDNNQIKLANGAQEFVTYSLENYDCYWLTTHCKGDCSSALKYMKKYCSDKFFDELKKIKPTNFNVLKTDAIDFEDDFLWFDDFLLQSEIDVLDNKGKLSSWIQVDTYRNFDDLKNFKF